ncbi:MAG TPA: FtsX-like permease family protein [Usitatibacteraceae bacterium]|nr:FtsX-like permease family protein [Usitatibacteraceae bacterium]
MNAALVATLLRGSLSGNRWRSLLAIACIGLGVALAGAVHTLHASALDEIDRAARLLSGTADEQVRGPRNGFDDATYAAVALHPAVAVASPVVELEATAAGLEAPAAGRETTIRVLGIDPFRASRLQPGFLAEGATSRAGGTPTLLDAHAAWLTPAAIAKAGATVGGDVALRGPLGEVRLKIAGTLPALEGGGPIAVMDIAAAQLAFGRVGVIHRIDLRLAPGAARETVLREIAAKLPPGVSIVRPDESTMRTAGLTRAYRVNLTALALMALFTGGFLVFSTLALQAAKRRQEFALLRALGLTGNGVRAFLALEGGLLGLAGAALGTVLGLVASRAMLERFGYDLGAGFFPGSGDTFAPDAVALAVIALLGVFTAAAAALAVTRSLARLDVAQALKDRHLDLPSPPGGWAWPIALALAAILAAWLPPAGEIPVGGYLSIGLALAAAVMAVSPASRLLLDRIPASDAPLRTLARAQVKSLPGHLSAMVSGIVVSVALTAAMAIMVFSFRVSLDQWLTGILEADFFARAAPQGDAVVFGPEAQAQIAAVPGVARIDPIRFERLAPEGSTGLLTVMARPVDAALLAGFQVDPPAVPARDGAIPAWISEASVDLFGWRVGQVVTIPLAGRSASFRVAGIFRDYARTWGALLVDLADYRALTNDAFANDIAIHLASGADAGAVEARIAKVVAQVPGAELHDASYIHARALRIFDRTFAATYALEAAAILIALAGVTSSFAALAWSRRREFGVLRHLGLARGDVMRLLALEGGAAGIIGALLGLVAGAAVSVVLVHVVNRQSFHWGMAIHWPWLGLAVLLGSVVFLCALGASLAGRAAVAREAVHAVKDDA